MSRQRERIHVPDRGEVCWLDLEPTRGTKEIGKYRPCLILTRKDYNEARRLCIFVPITTDLAADSLCIPIPSGLLDKPGHVLCDRIHSVCWVARHCKFITTASPEFVSDVVLVIRELIDPRLT